MKTDIQRILVLFTIVHTLIWSSSAHAADAFNDIEQPTQMVSPVEYDPDLVDPFFDVIETSWPWWIVDRGNGSFEDTTGEITKIEDIPVLTHTADCRTQHQGLHRIKFARAKLLKDGTIELKIEDESASTWDSLTIGITHNQFSSQYRTRYLGDPPDVGLIWTTTKQRLVLQKNKYNKGDAIKGRIEFECLQEITNPKYGGRHSQKIRVEGSFKPTLELE